MVAPNAFGPKKANDCRLPFHGFGLVAAWTLRRLVLDAPFAVATDGIRRWQPMDDEQLRHPAGLCLPDRLERKVNLRSSLFL